MCDLLKSGTVSLTLNFPSSLSSGEDFYFVAGNLSDKKTYEDEISDLDDGFETGAFNHLGFCRISSLNLKNILSRVKDKRIDEKYVTSVTGKSLPSLKKMVESNQQASVNYSLPKFTNLKLQNFCERITYIPNDKRVVDSNVNFNFNNSVLSQLICVPAFGMPESDKLTLGYLKSILGKWFSIKLMTNSK
jgi:hypothetical protein